MTLPSIKHFDISFICRTSENLKNYQGEYEFTMLLNSLLGLIIVPKEQLFKKYMKYNSFRKKIKETEVLIKILNKPKERLLKGKKEVEQKKFYWLSESDKEISFKEVKVEELLTRIRNSIAHFGITPVASPEKKDWYGVILQNYRECDKKLNFELFLKQDEIKDISEFIANKYIENIKPQNK